MRTALALGLAVLVVGQARYNLAPRLKTYPQGTPKETLASVLAAIDDRRIDYLLAQLTDPEWVDRRVKDVYAGRFDELVQEATTTLAGDPAKVKELRRFQKEGEWEGADTTASVHLKDVKDRQAFFKKIGTRWYLENRQKPESEK
jgi:hypothetical protein